jgi:replicative DNA helicase
MSGIVDRDEFINMLIDRFPEIAEDIDESSQGLLHLEMQALARAAQAAISAENIDSVSKHFEFIDEVFRRGDQEVKNAVCVSYLELIRFDGRRAKRIKARNMLSQALKTASIELEKYNAELKLIARRAVRIEIPPSKPTIGATRKK